MTNRFKMSDSVLHRFVQIVQEAILTGTDVSDHLRMVEMEDDPKNPGRLVLTADYKDLVKKQHEQLLAFAEQEKKQRTLLTEEGSIGPGIIVGTGAKN
jgi:hypothetical protein